MSEEWTPIPGETPLVDRVGLKIPRINTRRQLDEAEAANVANAIFKHLGRKPSRRTAPFHYEWCLKVHADMFGDIWEWAGQVRTSDLTLGIPHYLIRESLKNLTLDLRAWADSGMEVLEQSVLLHHRAVHIHPFKNGNGRWSRLLANILLKRAGASIIEWPETTLIGTTASSIRSEYIAAMIAADHGDYAPLRELCRRFYSPARR